MAPNLARSTLDLIHDMLISGELTTSQMAETAGCSKRAIIRLRANLQLFGSLKAPQIKGGRPRKITPVMLEALCDYLLEKPDLYLHEMELFLLDEFDIGVPKSTISDALRRKGWSKRLSDNKQGNAMLICEMNIYISSQISARTTWSMLTSLDVTNG